MASFHSCLEDINTHIACYSTFGNILSILNACHMYLLLLRPHLQPQWIWSVDGGMTPCLVKVNVGSMKF